MVHKRRIAEVTSCGHLNEEELTEFYRRACLYSLYQNRLKYDPDEEAYVGGPFDHAADKGRAAGRVSFNERLDIIGYADPTVDRKCIPVTPVSKQELMSLLQQRKFPRIN